MRQTLSSTLFGIVLVTSLAAPSEGQTPASSPTAKPTGNPTLQPTAQPEQQPEQQPQADGAFAELARAAKAIEAGKGADAERILRGVAARIPRYPNVWQQLAIACRMQGKTKPAFDAIEKAIGFGKPNADMHLLAAELALASSSPGAAKHALAAVELEPKQERTLARALDVLLEANDLDEAQKLFLKLQQSPGKSAASREKLLWLQADLANRKLQPELAAKAYRQLCDLVGDRDPFPHECLANTLIVLGKKAEALAAFTRCLAIHPSNLTAREREITLMKALRVASEDVVREENLLVYYRKVWDLEKKAGTKGSAPAQPVRPAAPK